MLNFVMFVVITIVFIPLIKYNDYTCFKMSLKNM